MSNERVNAKRTKRIDTWFHKVNVVESCSKEAIEPLMIPSSPIAIADVPLVRLEPQENINALERDPGKRCHIWKYPVNEQDRVRRTYISLGPYQPKYPYPATQQGSQQRKFQYSWFKDNPWHEYSITLDKAYCFPCFLFDSEDSRHTKFTEEGFQHWRKVYAASGSNAFVKHVGSILSPHNVAMQKWDDLRNPAKQIEEVFLSKSSKDIEDNRLRINLSIESVRLLAKCGAPFRGDDESESSLNTGNFREVINYFSRISLEAKRVILNAPGNAKYISPSIQKEILNILGNKVRAKIRDEIGDYTYCILVDEAVDISSREQMAIILRFVDCEGIIRERFFQIVSVPNTTSQTLKNEICKVLTMYNLQLRNIRGQGYDGASIMRGIYNGLQALFLEDCPYTYYVHCFAHRLQLTLNATAKGVSNIWQFFSTLNLIVNFVDYSAKRHSALKVARKEEIENLIACGDLQSCSGANQVSTLQRAVTTRWGSHFCSIKSLIALFSSTKQTLWNMTKEGQGSKEIKAEAKAVLKAMSTFDFVFCLLLMHKVMKVTEVLCQILQKKSLDYVDAMNFLADTKSLLQEMRQEGCANLLSDVHSFFLEHDIDVPNMNDLHKEGTGRRCQQRDGITIKHFYRSDVFHELLDLQLGELDRRPNIRTSYA